MKTNKILFGLPFALAVAAFFFVGCSAPALPVYDAYGTVRSVYSEYHGYEVRTVVALETHDGKLIDLELDSIDPRFWQGEKIELRYQQAVYGPAGQPSYCPYDGRPLFKALDVRRLD